MDHDNAFVRRSPDSYRLLFVLCSQFLQLVSGRGAIILLTILDIKLIESSRYSGSPPNVHIIESIAQALECVSGNQERNRNLIDVFPLENECIVDNSKVQACGSEHTE